MTQFGPQTLMPIMMLVAMVVQLFYVVVIIVAVVCLVRMARGIEKMAENNDMKRELEEVKKKLGQ